MTFKKILIIPLFLIQSAAYCQTYSVNLEDREKTVNLTNQAFAMLDESKTDEAITLLTNAISTDSTYHPAYLQIYRASLLNKDYSQSAIFYLKKAQRIFQQDDEITFYLGEIYRMNSDLKNAISEYDSAISYSKINGEEFELVHKYYANRGNCYYKMDSLELALQDYNYALQLKPDYIPALLNRGICLYKKGNKQDACSDWGKASAIGSTAAKEYIEKYCKMLK